ncbi:response regulator [Glycomyces sp. TRM65418]|uniref:response regulator n=1 Tax=Glycomyces sp. TRM65418 TaxID=2867006 RepID=UPI001CE69537|nr:response regulator [Glycomyces sp. TRM65418]MCC3761760.1 response regulator [Glycomyces sp. TRM65418]QZD55844.1 response regulator [Glycomyces sp. TRM65418]
MTKVLVVDDDPQIVRTLRINLAAGGYEVVTAVDGTAALRSAEATAPDVVVLDLGLPDMDGTEVITGLRGWTAAPILVLSGRTGSTDKITALDVGADDYVTKPFDIGELLARLRAMARRQGGEPEPTTVHIGNVLVDLAARTVHRGAVEIRLTRTEWRLLEVLLRNPGKLVVQRRLLHEVWGPTYRRETNYLRQYMAQLRRKLEPEPSRPVYLLTEPGMGYRFKPDPE